MSHEVSETIDRPSGAYNVYGGTQYPLNPIFGFERSRYGSIPEAVNAAQWRSRMGSGPEGGQSPAYGFQPQPQPEYIGYLNKVLEVLSDPRNQWMGTGLMGGTIKGVGGLRSFFEYRQPFRDPGGFHVPASDLIKKNPSLDSYRELAKDGLGAVDQGMANTRHITDVREMNRDVKNWGDPNPLRRQLAQDKYLEGTTHDQLMRDKVFQGLEALKQAGRPPDEGPPPEMVKRLFGY